MFVRMYLLFQKENDERNLIKEINLLENEKKLNESNHKKEQLLLRQSYEKKLFELSKQVKVNTISEENANLELNKWKSKCANLQDELFKYEEEGLTKKDKLNYLYLIKDFNQLKDALNLLNETQISINQSGT